MHTTANIYALLDLDKDDRRAGMRDGKMEKKPKRGNAPRPKAAEGDWQLTSNSPLCPKHWRRHVKG